MASEQPQSSGGVNLAEIEYKQLVIQESAKTRADIKQYLDRKTIEYEKTTKNEIEENLRVFDERIDGKIRGAGFKFGMIFFCGLIAGMMIVYLIKRRVDKNSIIKSSIPDQHFQEGVEIQGSQKPFSENYHLAREAEKPVSPPKPPLHQSVGAPVVNSNNPEIPSYRGGF